MTRCGLPLRGALALSLLAAAGRAGAAWSPDLKIDHLGYRTADRKLAVLTVDPSGVVELRRVSDGSLAYTVPGGSIVSAGVDADAGDPVWLADFTPFTTPGTYYLQVPSVSGTSYAFTIADAAYDALALTVLKAMYFERCGTAHPVAYMGASWGDAAACHTQDAACAHNATDDGGGADYGTLDLSGGWHDAGDYNKYLGANGPFSGDAGNAIWYLSLAYDLNPTVWADGQTNIPESGNGVPDLLDEIRWGLDFYLKMKRPGGQVLSIVHAPTSGPGTATPPSADATVRQYSSETADATAIAGACFAIGARLFAARDPAYSATLTAAANAAWTWLGATSSEAKLWFAAELYRAAPVGPHAAAATTFIDGFLPWALADNWGAYVSACFFNGTSYGVNVYRAEVAYTRAWRATPATVAAMRTQLGYLVDNAFTVAGPYGSGMQPWEYSWSSNENKSLYGLLLTAAERIGALGSQTAGAVRDQAQAYLHYLCGVNAPNMLYVTNLAAIGGEHSIWRIYHGWYPFGDANYYGKPSLVAEPDYPYTAGPDSLGIDDNVSSLAGPFPGIVADGPDANYPEANCAGNGVTPPLGAASRHRAYRDWAFCCQGPDASGNVACPWQVNETGIYYIASFAALAGQHMSPLTPPGPVLLTAYAAPPDVALNWSPAPTPGAISRYEVFRATCATCWMTFIGDAGAGTSWFVDAAATAAGLWSYRVVPRDTAGLEGPGTTVPVKTPGLTVARLTAAPAVLGVDQLLTVTMTVSNSGAVPVTNVAPAWLTPSGSGRVTGESGPSPASLALLDPGQSGTFTWTFRTLRGGTMAFTGAAAAVGSPSAAAVASNPAVILDGAGDLTRLEYYPTPFRTDQAVGGTLKFRRMPAGTHVRLYDAAGLLIRDLEADGFGVAEWNARNAAGRKVAGGVYFFAAVSPAGEKRLGKVELVH